MAINTPFATYIPVSIQKHDLTQIAQMPIHLNFIDT